MRALIFRYVPVREDIAGFNAVEGGEAARAQEPSCRAISFEMKLELEPV
jgi:hypothetical protein